MSVVNQKNLKVLLPRVGPEEFWETVFESFPENDRLRWKWLAMLALRVTAGWPLERIGLVFDHKTGHVSRSLRLIKEELREQFDPPDEWFEEGEDLGIEDGS